MIEAIFYIVFCLLTGLCGSQRRLGFFGTFLISIVLTPVIVLLVLLLTGPSRRTEWHHRVQGS
jgi:peptidoglycan/LPS O-acetylase OafA/YrhL